MMDWTDRHCRYLHRLMSRQALLYTEMVTAPAMVHGDARQFAARSIRPNIRWRCSWAARIRRNWRRRRGSAADEGYDEINLNVGCPSDRVQSGCFGAVLMKQPGLVADCVAAMIAAHAGRGDREMPHRGRRSGPVSRCCPRFLRDGQRGRVCRASSIHARKAWLQGLSPKENRDIPPLDYDLVYAMKRAFPRSAPVDQWRCDLAGQAQAHLAAGMDGVMIGRAAYHTPVGYPAGRG